MAAPVRRKPTIATTKTLAKQTSDATADSSPTNTIVRLHITPLSPSLLPTLLPRSLFAPSSSSSYSYPPPVSYHTLEAFPEKNYGYVDLPAQLAHKVTTRLNGTVFRGVKVSVQRARPRIWVPPQKQQLQHPASEEPGFDSAVEITLPQIQLQVKEDLLLEANKPKKKEDGVYPGIQLPDNRWVKRAWTKITVTTGTGMGKQKDKKDKKSKQNEAKKGHLLFQTTLPPTVPLLAATDPKQIKKLEKKRKRAIAAAEAATEAAALAVESNSDVAPSASEPESKRKKKKKDLPEVKLPRDKVTIKEMARNQKFPGFLKTSQLDPNNKRGKVTEFVEGVGWVDTSGNVVDDSAVRKPTMKGHERLKMEKPVVSLEEETQQIEIKNHEMEDEALGSGSESEAESEATERREEGQGSVPKVHNNDGSEIILIGTTTKIGPKIESSGSVGNIDTKENVVINLPSSNSPRSASSPSSSASDISVSEALDTGTDIGSSSEDSSDSNREDSFDSNSEDNQEAEEEEGPEKKKEDMKKEKPKLSMPQEILKTPSLKLAIPQPDMQKPHPLEALFKPNVVTTNDTRPSSGGLFDFGVTDEEDNDEMKDEHFETPQKRPYRSAAPTPDTAVANKTIKWPDPSTVSIFEPTTPIAPQKLRFQQSQTTVSGDTDAPLLFQGNADSAFLRGLSIWSGGHLPEAKGVTERPPEEEEGQQDTQDTTITRRSKRGNANEVVIGKHKERKIGQGAEVSKKAETRKEIWKERFFKYRGEWNREWKNKKREAGKLARRKKRERGIGNAK